MVDRYEAVERFAKLRDEGVISEEEFAAEKAKLLGGDAPQPDFAAMRSATAVEPAKRSRWPLWLGLTALALTVVVLGLLLATRPTQVAPITPAAAAAVAHEPPSCDSAVTRELLTKAVGAAGDTLVTVSHVDRGIISATHDLRTCTADLTLAGKGVQNRTFQLLAPENGGPLQLSFMDMTAPVSGAPAGNIAAPEDSTAAEESDEPSEAESDKAYYAWQAAAAAKKVIVLVDEQGQPLCCVNVGDVVRFFSGQGGSATYNTSDDGSVTLDIKDPSGRWRGLTAFELNFVKLGTGNTLVRVTNVSINGDTLNGVDPAALLRATFNLRPSGTAPGGQ